MSVRAQAASCADARSVSSSALQMEDSVLDLIIAGTSDAILMIEGFCDFLTEEQMLAAVEAGHSAVRGACQAIADWCVVARKRTPSSTLTCGLRTCRAATVGKPKDMSTLVLPPAGLRQAVSELACDKLEAAVRLGVKQERARALQAVDTLVMEALSAQARALWCGVRHCRLTCSALRSMP